MIKGRNDGNKLFFEALEVANFQTGSSWSSLLHFTPCLSSFHLQFAGIAEFAGFYA